MRRFTSIFTLLIMLITAVQPVIAMHFCGDELSSLQIYQTSVAQDSCCGDSQHHDVLISGNFCCETEMLELSTDEYQTKAEQLVTRLSSFPIDIVGMALIKQLFTTEPDSDNFLTALKFPPKGLYLDDVSILTYICIYRI